MPAKDSVEDLGKLDFSRVESVNGTSPKKAPPPVVKNPSSGKPKVAMPIQSKVAVLSGPDRFFFRLNKLMSPTKDFGSILTTINYGLYLMAYFDHKAHSLKTRAVSLVTRAKAPEGLPIELPVAPAAETSPFARLGKVVYNTRLTLRLFGLLPIYVRVRKLMTESKSMDHVLYIIAAIQCSLFAIFQFLENIAFLTDSGVLSKRKLGRFTGLTTGRVSTMYKIAHRAWFLGIMCEFPRLMREAQIFFRKNHLEEGEITQEEAEKAANWYYEWIRPLAWLPIGWHLSAWSEDKMSGMNLGVKGIAGVLADLRRTAGLWHATKDA